MRPFDCAPVTLRWSGEFHLQPNGPALCAKDSEKLARLLDWTGWPYPLVLDDDGNIVAGAFRLSAIKLLGDQLIPVVNLKDLKRKDLACFEAADARVASLAGWGEALLASDRGLLERLAERHGRTDAAIDRSTPRDTASAKPVTALT